MSEKSEVKPSRLSEASGVILLAASAILALSLLSYHPADPSWNTFSGIGTVHNWIGVAGAHIADLYLQGLGLAAYLVPLLIAVLAWKRLRSKPVQGGWAKVIGSVVLIAASAGLLGLLPEWKVAGGYIPAGGLLGFAIASSLEKWLNLAGTAIVLSTGWLLSLYLVSTFSLASAASRIGCADFKLNGPGNRWGWWRRKPGRDRARTTRREVMEQERPQPIEEELPDRQEQRATPVPHQPELADIPIRVLEEPPPRSGPGSPEKEETVPPEPSHPLAVAHAAAEPKRPTYKLPPTSLLNEPPGKPPYQEEELKQIAARIKAKFEEFDVRGSVVQINPGPVVTTFEFKPDAGVKYSRIVALTEDLCLGLQAESILIERIPGKPTVGIEVPNSQREVICLRQILESEEFQNTTARLPIPLGKDIEGRIKIAALESMPHLLIAGSTGSGKSVLLNSMIVALLYRATPEQVKLILVDPKRLELGLYEGIPHLLTPVITDPKKATNALRNAVLEMERRLRLLASVGVRHIEQYNRKVAQLAAQPRSLFLEESTAEEDLQPLPYIVVFIDELADLMMVERGNVEESVTRLAQMARAVGIHLVLATQRPSVDVVTGLIKANFPARISFRVATRVDSRTILDGMGAEHLLGKGDMLFLPPGSSRLVRVHGALVTEAEINRVVDFWKEQAAPEYDATYLVAPPSEEDETEEFGEMDGEPDPLYREAVRVVLEAGKASTSILQRRLRLGYGRAARILDLMQKEGIIGPPEGSKPREILRRPDWLDIEDGMVN